MTSYHKPTLLRQLQLFSFHNTTRLSTQGNFNHILTSSNKFDPCHHIISHSSQPVTISETILPFLTDDGTFHLPEYFDTTTPEPIIKTTFSLPINREELYWSQQPYKIYNLFRSKNGYISILPQDPLVHTSPPDPPLPHHYITRHQNDVLQTVQAFTNPSQKNC